MIKIPSALSPITTVISKIYDKYKEHKKIKRTKIVEDRITGNKELSDEFNAFQRWMIRFGKDK